MMKGKFRKPSREEAMIVAQHAEEWLERMKSTAPHDRVEFLRWLKQSPLHIRELLLATTWDKILGHMLDAEHKVDINDLRAHAGDNVLPLGGGDDSSQPVTSAIAKSIRHDASNRRPGGPRRKFWLLSLSAAACLTVALALGWTQFSGAFGANEQFVTLIGEQRSVGLDDGSVIHLNTKSRVRVAFTADARDVYLLEGQAIFKVKHDAQRPFRVHVDSMVVQAIGTQFDVYRLNGRTSVAVIEGIVQIIQTVSGKVIATDLSKLPESTKVPAGEKVVIAADGKMSPRASITSQEASAWQQRLLIFRQHTLAEIAAEFNRYNRTPQIRVEGDALRKKRFSGVFDADNPELLLLYLKTDSRFTFDRTGEELILRMRSSLAQSAPAK